LELLVEVEDAEVDVDVEVALEALLEVEFEDEFEDEDPHSASCSCRAVAWSAAVQLALRQVSAAVWKAVLEHTQVRSV